MSKQYLAILICLLSVNVVAQQKYTQVNRYTSVDTKPSQDLMNPLASIIKINVPRDVMSVGNAIKYVLSRTGYSLSASDVNAEHLFTLQLPEVHRVLGPFSAEDALRVLGGSEFELHVNHVKRVVYYTVKTNVAPNVAPVVVPSSNPVSAKK